MYMALLTGRERKFLEAVSKLSYANPFLPERPALEKAALGSDFVAGEPVWSVPVDHPETPRANHWRVVQRAEPLIEDLRGRLKRGGKATTDELVLYEDAVIHTLYQRCYPKFFAAGFGDHRDRRDRWSFYRDYRRDWSRFFDDTGVNFPTRHEPVHTFACFRQIQTAFEQIFRDIIGSSMPAARLRGSVWQSIFTHDMRRSGRRPDARRCELATLS